jgi:glutathione synthase/RimK-type ligase-like ATP-grasp enzyme
MKYIVFPYKMGSKSAKTLAQILNTKRVYADGNYTPKRRHVIINWGNSQNPLWANVALKRGTIVLNPPDLVKIASNKLETFKCLEGIVSIPAFTTDKAVATQWLEDDECKVMCRKLLNAHSGKGIVVAKEVDELVDAPLYTQYIKKAHEFRVHVFNGKVIDYVQKKKRTGVVDRNKYVRSVENGWVFCRENILVRDDVKQIAIDAVNTLTLDFGAVDVILGHDGKLYVLEINTAIGIEGTTVESYKAAFANYLVTL